MKCTIPEKNLRAFAASVQCLSKVGKELVLECNRAKNGMTSMTLSTMNDGKTAFNVFTFFNAFFEKIQMENVGILAVKIPLRSLASVFKSIRNTERMDIQFEQDGARHVVVFISQCKGGLMKTHELHYEDTSVVHASFDRSQALNRIVARTSMFSKALTHISGSEEASMLLIPEDSVRLRSHYQHVDRSTELDTLHTAVSIGANELEELQVGMENQEEIAFGIKEIKALLQFCEVVDVVNMAFLCNGPGSPLMFSTDDSLTGVQNMGGAAGGATSSGSIQTFEAELVVATLEAEEIQPGDDASVASTSRRSAMSASESAPTSTTDSNTTKRVREPASDASEETRSKQSRCKHEEGRDDPMDHDMEGLEGVVPSTARRGPRLREEDEEAE